MNKLLLFCLFLYSVVAVRPYKERYGNVSKHLDNEFKKRNPDGGKPFNLKENINYVRKNNYELYVDANGELKQQNYNVNEPRQVLKKNMDKFRYLINDLEVLFGVYELNARDKEKVLRETLKKESLCFTIAGLVSNSLNQINVEDSPIYGLLIQGERDRNYEVNNTLDIYVILSNISVPLGSFFFPEMKRAPYQLPYLVGHYDSRSGIKNKSISYLCPLPEFLIDVMRTTKYGLKFNFNGTDLDVKELFPVTLTNTLETASLLPVQKEDSYKNERNVLLGILQNISKDIPYRKVVDRGVQGNGIINPEERILASKSFSSSRENIKNFVSNSGKSSLDTSSMALYFLALSQNLFERTRNAVPSSNRLTNITVTNVQTNNAGYLTHYTLKLGLENSRSLTVEGLVNGKNIFVPKGIQNIETVVSYDVPYTWGIMVSPQEGFSYIFGNFVFDIAKSFSYNVNNLSSFVRSP